MSGFYNLQKERYTNAIGSEDPYKRSQEQLEQKLKLNNMTFDLVLSGLKHVLDELSDKSINKTICTVNIDNSDSSSWGITIAGTKFNEPLDGLNRALDISNLGKKRGTLSGALIRSLGLYVDEVSYKLDNSCADILIITRSDGTAKLILNHNDNTIKASYMTGVQ